MNRFFYPFVRDGYHLKFHNGEHIINENVKISLPGNIILYRNSDKNLFPNTTIDKIEYKTFKEFPEEVKQKYKLKKNFYELKTKLTEKEKEEIFKLLNLEVSGNFIIEKYSLYNKNAPYFTIYIMYMHLNNIKSNVPYCNDIQKLNKFIAPNISFAEAGIAEQEKCMYQIEYFTNLENREALFANNFPITSGNKKIKIKANTKLYKPKILNGNKCKVPFGSKFKVITKKEECFLNHLIQVEIIQIGYYSSEIVMHRADTHLSKFVNNSLEECTIKKNQLVWIFYESEIFREITDAKKNRIFELTCNAEIPIYSFPIFEMAETDETLEKNTEFYESDFLNLENSILKNNYLPYKNGYYISCKENFKFEDKFSDLFIKINKEDLEKVLQLKDEKEQVNFLESIYRNEGQNFVQDGIDITAILKNNRELFKRTSFVHESEWNKKDSTFYEYITQYNELRKKIAIWDENNKCEKLKKEKIYDCSNLVYFYHSEIRDFFLNLHVGYKRKLLCVQNQIINMVMFIQGNLGLWPEIYGKNKNYHNIRDTFCNQAVYETIKKVDGNYLSFLMGIDEPPWDSRKYKCIHTKEYEHDKECENKKQFISFLTKHSNIENNNYKYKPSNLWCDVLEYQAEHSEKTGIYKITAEQAFYMAQLGYVVIAAWKNTAKNCSPHFVTVRPMEGEYSGLTSLRVAHVGGGKNDVKKIKDAFKGKGNNENKINEVLFYVNIRQDFI